MWRSPKAQTSIHMMMPSQAGSDFLKKPHVLRRGVWWLSPSGLILGFLVPVFLAIMLLGEIRSPALTVRGVRFLSVEYSLIGLGLMVVMALMAFVGERVELRSHGPVYQRRWGVAAWLLGGISLGAYLFWFREIFFSPAVLWGVLTGSIVFGRDQISAVAGVSSLVNFLPVFFALLAHVWATKPDEVSPGLRRLAVILLVLTVFRVYVWAERLALIELGVAVLVPYLCAKHESLPGMWRKLVLVLPIFGVPAMMLYFGVGEYFRSWQSDLYQGSMPFWEFAAGRFASYYFTSLNNGAGLLATQSWPTYDFEYTLAFAYKAPSIFGAIFRYYVELEFSTINYLLSRYADPEFNNPSGLYSVVFDLGVSGALIYFAALGFLSGVLYRAMLNGLARGVLLYPLFFVMLLEVYRYPYFGQSRSFTALLGVGLALYLITFGRIRAKS